MARDSEEIRSLVSEGKAKDLTEDEALWAYEWGILTGERAVAEGVHLKGITAPVVADEDQPPHPGDVDTKLPAPADPFNGSDEDKALEDMSKEELQEQARLRDLPTSGNKGELLSSIVEFDEQHPDEG